MRDKFNKFMQGRYGVDDLSRFHHGSRTGADHSVYVCYHVQQNLGSIFDILGLAAIVYAYIRIFSRNIQQRYAENQKYLSDDIKVPFSL